MVIMYTLYGNFLLNIEKKLFRGHMYCRHRPNKDHKLRLLKWRSGRVPGLERGGFREDDTESLKVTTNKWTCRTTWSRSE